MLAEGTSNNYLARPILSDDVDILGGNMARSWNYPGQYSNNRFWPDGYTEGARLGFIGSSYLQAEYTLCVGTDVQAAMQQLGTKLMGFLGTWYDSGTLGGPWLDIDVDLSGANNWVNILWHGRYDSGLGGYPLSQYNFLCRDPSYLGVQGVPSWQNLYSGSGPPEQYKSNTTGVLIPGVYHRIRHTVRLNSVIDPNFRPSRANTVPAWQECTDNGNPDGLIRIELDGVTVYEANDVTFRGEIGTITVPATGYTGMPGFFAFWHDIYMGGTGSYTTSDSHYDYGQFTLTDEEASPGRASMWGRRP